MPKNSNTTKTGKKQTHGAGSTSQAAGCLLAEGPFRQMLCRERKRSERSRQPLLLMLIDDRTNPNSDGPDVPLQHVSHVLCGMLRETDLAGWFESGKVLGAIFTELGSSDIGEAAKIISAKITTEIQQSFQPGQSSHFQISFYAFPDGWNGDGHRPAIDPALYPDLFEDEKSKRIPLLAKRVMDILGSTCALVACTPLFVVLAILIKLTSKGPILFRQERIGRYGTTFQFLKFRSMRVSNDASIHREYVKKFIAGQAGSGRTDGEQETVYKITNDPRVTWVGKIMRRTSLDELPQFWNVLKGEMSLVGPRPPISYELEAYDIWHRRRLLEAKPGITGLWQVQGRSKTTFDEMVRLDLHYSKTWSPLLDIKILLQTPRAVFSGDGAY